MSSRPIRFRAWDSKDNRWLREDEVSIVSSGELLDLAGNYMPEDRGVVIQQFTGLLDKNGKEIYEGDVMNLKSKYEFENDKPIDTNSEVLFVDGGFRMDFHGMRLTKELLKSQGNWDLKVIGNIYENPELMK
jgi:uncharacterized phage protein (TIGR01671 family)